MRTRADSPTKNCTEPGCGRPLRARGLCSTHYNRRYCPTRHVKVTVPCDWCGKPCVKDKARNKRYGGLFCSYPCRDAWRKATGNNPCPSEAATAASRAALRSRRVTAKRKLRRAARGTRGTVWAAGWCEHCGAPFVSIVKNDIGRYCSEDCVRRTKARRRRARARGARRVPYSRTAIFRRDGYRCHLCRRLTIPTAVVPHPRAPVIDHLIPLGPGGDAPDNVATACFECNSRRRDVGPAQLLLFG